MTISTFPKLQFWQKFTFQKSHFSQNSHFLKIQNQGNFWIKSGLLHHYPGFIFWSHGFFFWNDNMAIFSGPPLIGFLDGRWHCANFSFPGKKTTLDLRSHKVLILDKGSFSCPTRKAALDIFDLSGWKAEEEGLTGITLVKKMENDSWEQMAFVIGKAAFASDPLISTWNKNLGRQLGEKWPSKIGLV